MIELIKADWPAPPNIYAGTTTRLGGVSNAPYQSLNLADHVGDNPAHVMQNRQNLRESLQLTSEPVWLAQCHSTVVVEATPQNINVSADAAFTNKAGNVCVVMTGDCLPLLICNKQGTIVAASHAGWRGLADGIIEATLDKLPCSPEDLLVWIGPAHGKKTYEVGKDVYDIFVDQDVDAKNYFTAFKQDKWLADLAGLAKLRLMKRHVNAVYGGNRCTYTEEELFFSARREKMTGRIASLIWMK